MLPGLYLKSLQSRINAAHRHVFAAQPFKLARDGHAVCILAQLNCGKKDHQFELSEIAPLCH